jgi:hypothetical protein
MNIREQLTEALGVPLSLTGMQACERICEAVPGYSDAAHYRFFERSLALPGVHDVLILGVYRGRDIAFMLDAARAVLPRDRALRIVGVDKFTDDSCTDWPAYAKSLSWSEAGFGMPPNYEEAKKATGFDSRVELIVSDDSDYLEKCDEKFDVIYMDTAHDFETVNRQIRQVRPLARAGALICGDDYQEKPRFGVIPAVRKNFKAAGILGRVWYAALEDYQ